MHPLNLHPMAIVHAVYHCVVDMSEGIGQSHVSVTHVLHKSLS